jgi:hypothetical protein
LLRFDAEARVLTVTAFYSNDLDPDPNSQVRKGRITELLEENGRLWTKDWSCKFFSLVYRFSLHHKKERSVEPLSDGEEDMYWGFAEVGKALCVEANTGVDEKKVLRLARKKIAAIQRCARQKMEPLPAAPQLADWIYLGYVFGMYPEGAAPWRYVGKDEIDVLKYKRTEKFSAVCRAKVGS